MRNIAFFCLILASLCSCEVVIRLDPADMEKALQSVSRCIGKHGLNFDIVKKLNNRDNSKDEKFLKFLYCTLNDLKVVKKDGHYIEEEALKFVPKQQKQVVKKALEECNKKTGSDKLDVLHNISMCMKEKDFRLAIA